MREYLYRLATDQVSGLNDTAVKALLRLLSFVYGACVKIILFGYQFRILPRHILAKPVISIGNITLGGAGKTPLTELAAEFLCQKKLKPVILTRGYMPGRQKSSDGALLSDEVSLLKENLPGVPVLAGEDRVRSGKEAVKNYPADIFILDDGFQHWRLARDLDIVVIDSTNPFGNRCLIPRGTLREPLGHLSRAHIFVLSKVDLGQSNVDAIKERLRRVNAAALIVEAVHEPVELIDLRRQEKRGVDFLKGKGVGCFCSIGNGPSFGDSVARLGARVKHNFCFMDHHVYAKSDMDAILEFCRANRIDILVTTQKDAVKLGGHLSRFNGGPMVFALKIKMRILKGKDEFYSRISYLSSR